MGVVVMVTGGAGYVGSHATLCLLKAGYQVRGSEGVRGERGGERNVKGLL